MKRSGEIQQRYLYSVAVKLASQTGTRPRCRGPIAKRHQPRHEAESGVCFAGPDKLVHLVEAGEVVYRLGRGFVEHFHRKVG